MTAGDPRHRCYNPLVAPPSGPAPTVVRFGAFEADLATGELRRKGVRISLQEQPFQVMALLVERPGELVTREQIRQRIWPRAVNPCGQDTMR